MPIATVRDMDRENAFLRLAGLLSSRVAEEYRLPQHPEAVTEVLEQEARLARGDAEALAWGSVVDLAPEATTRIAAAFSLHAGLLGCILRPSSWEGIEHVLTHDLRGCFCDDDCGVCDLIAERSFMLSDEESEDPLSVVMDALEHVNPQAPALEDGGPKEELVGEDRFTEVIAILPEASRLRVLAFAYQELAEVTSGHPIGEFAAYARLRRDYLTPLSRAIFDQLADSPEGELTTTDLLKGLGLPDGRALGQLTRSISRSLKTLARDGHPLTEDPLELRRPTPRDRRLRMRPRALSAWRALLRAEAETVGTRSENVTALEDGAVN
jgi:DNA-binding transcriptional ArsR family regulator